MHGLTVVEGLKVVLADLVVGLVVVVDGVVVVMVVVEVVVILSLQVEPLKPCDKARKFNSTKQQIFRLVELKASPDDNIYVSKKLEFALEKVEKGRKHCGKGENAG